MKEHFISFSDFPYFFKQKSTAMHYLTYSRNYDLRLKLSVRLYMLSPPREVRPSCELEQSETFNNDGRPRNEQQRIVVIVNACTVG